MTAKTVYGTFGLDRTAAKESVKPGDDFFAKTASELSRLFGEPGFQSPIGAYIGPDDKNSETYSST